MTTDRIEEIRNFVLRVYGEHDIVGYGDKALMYCKDLLTALDERDRRIAELYDKLHLEMESSEHYSAKCYDLLCELDNEKRTREAAEREVKELKNPKEFIMCPCCLMREIRIKKLEAKVTQAYNAGYNEGVSQFAWWKDGEQFVGTCGTKLKDVLRSEECT